MKKGFTLAEVLITIGIIGIVAALTIPAVINRTNELENYARFKKKYAELSQASQQIIQDSGGTLTRYYWASTNAAVDDYARYISFLKQCTNAASQGCWNSSGALRFDTGVSIGLVWTGPGAIMKDGTYLYAYADHTDLRCDDTQATMFECARLYVDINGNKQPNTLGKDIFEMNLHQTKLGIGGAYAGTETSAYGGQGWGMTAYCLINKCPQ